MKIFDEFKLFVPHDHITHGTVIRLSFDHLGVWVLTRCGIETKCSFVIKDNVFVVLDTESNSHFIVRIATSSIVNEHLDTVVLHFRISFPRFRSGWILAYRNVVNRRNCVQVMIRRMCCDYLRFIGIIYSHP